MRFCAALLGMAIAGQTISGDALAAESGRIRIELRRQTLRIPNDNISIGDIATISGGSTAQRNRIASLDLEQFPSRQTTLSISDRQVQMRLLVDGFRRSQFVVSGPTAIEVARGTPQSLSLTLEAQLAREIARQFALDRDAVSVHLSNRQRIESVQNQLNGESYDIAVLLGSRLPMGKTFIEVEFSTQSGRRIVERFDTQVIIDVMVAVAKGPITAGTLIDQSMIQMVNRPFTRSADFAQQGQVVGRVAQRKIASNEVILQGYLSEPSNRQEPVVKRNDLLDVIVPLGDSEVRLKNARSMSVGHVGDTITVVNTRSNRQLSAVVVDRNLARVLPLTGRIRR